jgi:hypothetical protein
VSFETVDLASHPLKIVASKADEPLALQAVLEFAHLSRDVVAICKRNRRVDAAST